MERVEKSESLRKSFKAFSKKHSYKTESGITLTSLPIILLKLVKDFFIKSFNLLLHYFYRFTSYYGESWHRAVCVLIGVWFIFALIYTQVSFSVCAQDKINSPPNNSQICERNLHLSEAMKHSFGTMFLQKSETRKPLETAEIFILIESVLAPLQAALLALAIRRKFMR